MSTAPSDELQTERLALRRLTREDADLMLAVWNDPAFHKYVGDRGIRTIEQAQEAMAGGALLLYEEYGYGPFRVALRENDQPIGICGLFRREKVEDPDIGWSVLPDYSGRGYAFEAATAVLEYAFGSLGLTRILAFITEGNAPSVGLAKKLGLRYERMARIVGDDEDVCLYSVSNVGKAI